MVFKIRPSYFNPQMWVTACIIYFGERFLILLRDTDNPRWPNLWNFPEGHKIGDESAQAAVIRGVEKDTGIVLNPEQFRESQEFYVRDEGNEPEDTFDISYTVFVVQLETEPVVRLTPGNHSAFRWVTLRESVELPMIPKEDEIIDLILAV